MAHKAIQVSHPGTCEYSLVWQKEGGILADAIEGWGDYPGLSMWPQLNHKVSMRGGKMVKRDVTTKTIVFLSFVASGGQQGITNHKMQVASRTNKRQGTDSPPRTSRRSQPCQHLDLSPDETDLGLLISRLERVHLYYFKSLDLWSIITAALENYYMEGV